MVQTKAERLRLGMAPVENLLGARDVGEAAAGGITRFTSLLPGAERREVERPLPMTDVVLPALRRDAVSSAPAALDGRSLDGLSPDGGGGGRGGRAVMGMAPVREVQDGESGGGGGGDGGTPLVDESRMRGRSWCAAAEGGGATQWAAAREASEALAEALLCPEAAPVAAALAEVAGGDDVAQRVRASRGFEQRLAANDPEGHVLVGSSAVATELQAAVAKLRTGNGGGGGGVVVKVLVGKRGSMQGRNSLPVVLEPLPPPPLPLPPPQQQALKDGSRSKRRGRSGGDGGGGHGSGRRRGRASGGTNDRFRVKLVVGGVAQVGGGGGEGADASDCFPIRNSADTTAAAADNPLASESSSSRRLYGGATGVRGMDVDQRKLELSQAFWGGYGRGAKGLKPSHNH